MVNNFTIDKSRPQRRVMRQIDGQRFVLVATISNNLRGFLSGTSELLGWAVLRPGDSKLHDVVSIDPGSPSAYLDSKGLRYQVITPPVAGPV